MRLLPLITFAAGAFAFSTAGSPFDPLQKTVSTSRQFVLYGADAQVRGAAGTLAEQTKREFLELLRLPDEWKTPIVVNLQYPQANLPEVAAARLDLGQTGFGLKIQLDLLITAESEGPALQRELLRAILVEMIYRRERKTAAGSAVVQPPDWLLDGVLALAPGRGDSSTQLLQTIVAAKIIPLEQITTQRADLLDATSRQIYRAYSVALVQLLLDSPDGRARLARFIADLTAAPRDAAADLRAHFPAILSDAASAEKWWTLSIARLSAADRYQAFGSAETQKRLDQLLRIPMLDAKGARQEFALADFEKFLKLPSRRETLDLVSRELLLLGARAHPAYQPMVQEYADIAALLAHGKTHRIAARLTRLQSYREGVEEGLRHIDDYMNWFEGTQMTGRSGAFADYLKAVGKTSEAEPRRRDPISVYLDSLEEQMR